jgi:hypothetical protein
MSLQDQKRYLVALDELAENDSEVWVSVADLAAHMGREPNDLRHALRLEKLWESDLIDVSTDQQHVAITRKALWQMGKGGRPA